MDKSLFQFFDLTIQLEKHLIGSLPLLQEDDERHDFQGQQVRRIAQCGAMLQERLEECIEDQLVTAAKRAIERFQFRNQIKGELCCRGKSPAHKS